MAEKRDYSIGEIYQGSYSTLDPSKNEYFTGYSATAGSLGMTTDPRTANIIKDASTKLAAGSKHIELALVSPEIFDSIPKQQLKEMNRMAKLIGAEVSVHGPVIDVAGMGQEGWSETQRENAERKIFNTLDRSQEVNPGGNTTVVFHSAEGIRGSQWETLGDETQERKAKKLFAVDRETGQMTALETERMYYPSRSALTPEAQEKVNKRIITREDQLRESDFAKLHEGRLHTAEERLETVNRTQWDTELKKIQFQREGAEKSLRSVHPKFRELYLLWSTGKIEDSKISYEEREEMQKVHFAAQHMEEANLSLQNTFHKAYKIAKKENDQKTLQFLTKLSENYKENLGMNDPNGALKQRDPKVQSTAVFNMLNELGKIEVNQYMAMEDFATEKSSETFGNAAFKSYKKYKDKAPIMAIENPPAGFGLSTGEDLRNLVKASRKKFVEKAVEEGMSESFAKNQAEKLIGATWDVGHINMLRGQGFSEKEIIKETEKVAPFVKHVHLSDNFGFEHTELPMGMGNVPMKEIMDKLGKKGFEAKKIIEAGQWWQHFQTNPLKETMEGLGSAIYSDGVGPYWNQSLGLQQGYLGGYGNMLPQINYETFGAGFSRLPQELGGSTGQGAGGRMGGARE